MAIAYAAARALIDTNLSAEFDAVKSDTRADDTPASDTGIEAIEAFFNAPVEVWRDVPLADLAGYMEMRGSLYEDTATSALASAKKLSRILTGQSRVETFRMTDPATRTVVNELFTDLVDNAAWLQADKDGAIAVAKESVPRWRSESLGGVIGRGAIVLMKSGRV